MRAEHQGIPVTPEEQALAATESVAAGAGAIHVHVRAADGNESLAATDVAGALTAIRAAVPGIPIGVSTGAWIIRDSDARLRAVTEWTLLPDFASVNFLEAARRAAAHPWRGRGGGAVERARRRVVRGQRSRRALPAGHVRASGGRRRRGLASAGTAGGDTRRRRNQAATPASWDWPDRVAARRRGNRARLRHPRGVRGHAHPAGRHDGPQ